MAESELAMVEVYIGGLGEATGREKVLSAELKIFPEAGAYGHSKWVNACFIY